MIRAFHGTAEGAYGVRRMHRERVEAGVRVSRNVVVRRLMRENGTQSVHTPSFTKTTDSAHDFGFAPNLLEQDFQAWAPDRFWVGDITYIWQPLTGLNHHTDRGRQDAAAEYGKVLAKWQDAAPTLHRWLR